MNKWYGLCLSMLTVCLPAPLLADTPSVAYGKSAELAISVPGSEEWRVALRPAAPRLLDAQPLTLQGVVLWPQGGLSMVGKGRQLQLWSDSPVVNEVALPADIRAAWSGEGQSAVIQLDDDSVVLARRAGDHLQWVQGPKAVGHWQAAYLYAPDRLAVIQSGNLQLWRKLKTDWRVEGRLPLNCDGRAMAVRERSLLLACGAAGLVAVDLSRAGPVKQGEYSSGGRVVDLWLEGDVAYLANAEQGVTVVDISKPAAMRWLGSNNKFGPAYQLSPGVQGLMVRGAGGRVTLLDLMPLNQPAIVSQFDAGAADSLVNLGKQALVVTGQQLQRWQIGDAQMPLLNSSGNNLGGSRRVQIRDHLAYVADWFSGLHIYDISNPLAPRHLSNLHMPGSAKGVLLMDNYAFVGDDDNGLQVIDISNPAKPRWVTNLPTAGLAYTMRRADHLLYLADHRGGWNIIDISEPSAPKLLVNVDTPGKAWSLELYKNYLYVADDDTGVLIYDVSDPARPQQVGVFATGGFAEDVVIRGDTAYVAFFDQGVYLLDLKNPAKPQIISHLPSYGNARGIDVQGERLYLADWDAGLLVIDISNSKAPRIMGQLDTQGAAWGVAVQGGMAYVMDWWGGVKVVDVSNDRRPTLVSEYHQRGVLEQIVVSKGYAWVIGAQAGLQVFDVNNPDGPIWMAAIDLDGAARAIALGEKRAYISTANRRLIVIDISNPFQPVIRAQHTLQTPVVRMQASAGVLYTLDETGVVSYWDVTNDQTLTALGSFTAEYRDLSLQRDRLALLSDKVVELLDISQPARPQRKAQAPSAPENTMVRLADGIVYLAGEASEIRQLIQDGEGRLKEVARYQPRERIVDMQPSGRQLWLSGVSSGAMVLEFGAGRPWISQIYPAAVTPGNIAVDNQAIFMVGSERMLSARRMPALGKTTENGSMTIYIPEGLALGGYDLLLQAADGTLQWRSPAFSVKLKLGGKSSYTLDQFRKSLKTERQLPIEQGK